MAVDRAVGGFLRLLLLLAIGAGLGEGRAASKSAAPSLRNALDMVDVPARQFVPGSPDDESQREAGEGPLRLIELSAFRIARTETWRRSSRPSSLRPGTSATPSAAAVAG